MLQGATTTFLFGRMNSLEISDPGRVSGDYTAQKVRGRAVQRVREIERNKEREREREREAKQGIVWGILWRGLSGVTRNGVMANPRQCPNVGLFP